MSKAIHSFGIQAAKVQLAFFLALPVNAAQKHFVWAGNDGDSTVYIAGAIHGMFEPESTLPSVYSAILRASERLVLEADFDALASEDSLNHWARRASEFRIGSVPPNLIQQAQKLILNHGINPFALKAPWALALTIEDLRAQEIGIDFALGVDHQLYVLARAEGKEIIGLENFREHIDILPAVPVSEQIQWLEESLNASRNIADEWQTQITLWRTGNLEKFAVLDSPDASGYAQVIAERNQKWIPMIAALFSQPGVSFVVVGAGHLGRADGILAGLRNLGFESVQLEDPELSIELLDNGVLSIRSNMRTGSVVIERSPDLRRWIEADNATVIPETQEAFWRAVWRP